MAEAFYGRVGAYGSALAAGDRAALAGAIERNVFPDAVPAGSPERLAAYVEAVAACLAKEPVGDLRGGRLSFPPADLLLATAAA
jgi:cytochrome b pre-mRNA-processing protein 3